MRIAHAISILLIVVAARALELEYVEGYRDAIAKFKSHPTYMMSLLIVTTATDCAKCDEAINIYEEFMYLVDGAVKVSPPNDALQTKTYVLDCKSIQQNPEERQVIPACEVANVEQLPALTFFAPPEPDPNPAFKTPKSDMPEERQFRG